MPAVDDSALRRTAATILATEGGGSWRGIKVRHACGSPDDVHCMFTSGETLFDAILFRGNLISLELYSSKRKPPKKQVKKK